MSLVLNSYLVDKSLKIRSKAIPWDVSRSLPVAPPYRRVADLPSFPPSSSPSSFPHQLEQGYQRAGLLSTEDVGLIQRVVGNKDKAEPILDAVSDSLNLVEFLETPLTIETFSGRRDVCCTVHSTTQQAVEKRYTSIHSRPFG